MIYDDVFYGDVFVLRAVGFKRKWLSSFNEKSWSYEHSRKKAIELSYAELVELSKKPSFNLLKHFEAVRVSDNAVFNMNQEILIHKETFTAAGMGLDARKELNSKVAELKSNIDCIDFDTELMTHSIPFGAFYQVSVCKYSTLSDKKVFFERAA